MSGFNWLLSYIMVVMLKKWIVKMVVTLISDAVLDILKQEDRPGGLLETGKEDPETPPRFSDPSRDYKDLAYMKSRFDNNTGNTTIEKIPEHILKTLAAVA